MKIAAIIPAAGSGKRLKSKLPKAFVEIRQKPLLLHTLQRLTASQHFHEIIVVVHRSQIKRAGDILRRAGFKSPKVVEGGATRAESVKRGCLALSADIDYVLVHDAARPLVEVSVVRRVIAASQKTGAALCVLPVKDTVKRLTPNKRSVAGTVDRDLLCLAQTPQVFRKELLLKRYKALGAKALSATDEAALFDGSAVQVRVVLGADRNLKITTPVDLDRFRSFSCV